MKLDLQSFSKKELIEILEKLEDKQPGFVYQVLRDRVANNEYTVTIDALKEIVQRYSRDGFLNYKNTSSATNAIKRKLLKPAKVELENGSRINVFWKTIAVIESWTDQINNCDDSRGGTTTLMEASWSILNETIQGESDRTIKAEMSNYLLKLYTAGMFKDYDWHIDLAKALAYMKATKKVHAGLLEAIESETEEWIVRALVMIRLHLTRVVKGPRRQRPSRKK